MRLHRSGLKTFTDIESPAASRRRKGFETATMQPRGVHNPTGASPVLENCMFRLISLTLNFVVIQQQGLYQINIYLGIDKNVTLL